MRCKRIRAYRLIAMGVLAFAGFITVDHEAAAAYPERPIRWIVPAAAGGGADASARVIAAELGQVLGQQVVIDNRPGASGVIGIDLVAKAAPDGYTMGAGNITNVAMNRAVIAKLPYNAERDLRAVVQTHFQSNVLVATMSLPVKSVAELVDYARKNPGKLLYASSGNGSSLHFAGELFKLTTKTDIVHVPYRSVPLALTDLFAGRVHLILDNMSSIAPHVKGGKVRALGVTSSKRSVVFPELPTIAEAGVKDFEVTVWSGVIVSAGTPAAITARLNTAVNQVLQASHVREKLGSLGLEIIGGTSQQFAMLISNEAAKWADVARKAGIKAE